MTKRASEGAFGLALREIDVPSFVYKPGDGDMNMKPCDFMVWHAGEALDGWTQGTFVNSTWFEVKDVDTQDRFNFREIRASQWNAMRRARELGIPYWLAVYWRRKRMWTISDTAKLLDWREADGGPVRWTTYVPLASRFGIDSEPGMLVSTLKGVLLGEVS